jgi:mono/diheme cytochrome c family protein
MTLSPHVRIALVLAPLLLTSSPRVCAAEAPVDFDKQVRPLLTRTCFRCHGDEKQRGSLRLDQRDAALQGGDSGKSAIKPRDPAGSVLIQRITATDLKMRMPPKDDPRLSPAEIALLQRWIAEGANWSAGETASPASGKKEMVVTDADRQHWAFRRLAPIQPPAVRRADWVRTDVDRFVLASLEARRLAPAAEAERRTLIRRLTFDLIGLPPTPEEVEAFVHDPAADAYAKLVDRLLASPAYGERWARHWLDLARYADSDGYENDADRPTAYPYRDFVIRAFNRDLPYDRFLRWQLAGDELAPDDEDARAATGFLAAGPVVVSDTKLEDELRRYRADELDDILGTTMASMLGLTVGCARCHDHKFDPIPTRDYYQLLAAFTTMRRTQHPLPSSKDANRVLGVADPSAKAEPSWLLSRGDPQRRKEEVPLGFLSVLTRTRTAADYLKTARAAPGPTSTRQRAALASWLTDVDDGAGALAARVFVNRVWQHHFGEGLVRTPSDFGTQGERPTHPELLDWLAGRFVADGWSVTRLHRLIVTSAVYRQSIVPDPATLAADPDNRLLGRRRPRRLEAEVLRDTLLAASGTLNPGLGGQGVKAPVPDAARAAYNTRDPYPRDARDDETTRRRSVYLFAKRSLRQPLFEAFDGADPNISCPRRLTTTVAPQALALLNDSQIRQRARDCARRVLAEVGGDETKAVARAYALTLGRPPRPEEAEAAEGFLHERAQARKQRDKAEEARQLALVDFCQVLFSLNEFLYVD